MLTDEQYQEIRTSTGPLRIMAQKYGISISSVWAYRRGVRRFIHNPEPKPDYLEGCQSLSDEEIEAIDNGENLEHRIGEICGEIRRRKAEHNVYHRPDYPESPYERQTFPSPFDSEQFRF